MELAIGPDNHGFRLSALGTFSHPFSTLLIGFAHAEIMFPASEEWVLQMASRLLMQGSLALITMGTMCMR